MKKNKLRNYGKALMNNGDCLVRRWENSQQWLEMDVCKDKNKDKQQINQTPIRQ